MSFELTERIIAISLQDIEELLPKLFAQYGEELPDGNQNVRTIGGHWDDANKTRIRAASLYNGTIVGQQLTDGRLAFRCLWQSDLAKDFDDGKIADVEELTQEQLTELTPNPEEEL